MIREKITEMFGSIFREFKEDLEPPPLTDDTPLLGMGLDSLDFAVLVIRLQDELDYDPFTLSEGAYYPTTFGEFVSFYEQFAPT